MAKKNIIFIGSDALMQATEIKDSDSGDLINTATITLSIFEGVTRYPVSILGFVAGGTVPTIPIAVGDVITGAAGATAIVGKVDKTSGNWLLGTAAGLLEVNSQVGVFVAAETLTTDATVRGDVWAAGDSTGLAAITAAAGAKTQIPMNTTELTTSDFIRLQSTRNYNDQYAIDAIEDGLVTIVEPYVAENFTGREVIYIGIRDGDDLAFAHGGADPDGYYDGNQPDTLEGVYEGLTYYLFEKIEYGVSVVLHRYQWTAGYYENLAV